jgi:hypothetical protein
MWCYKIFRPFKKGDVILFVIDSTRPIKREWQKYLENDRTIVSLIKLILPNRRDYIILTKDMKNMLMYSPRPKSTTAFMNYQK